MLVVNNHGYKKYTYSLEERIKLIKQVIDHESLNKVEILYQDDENKLDFGALKHRINEPLCAVTGYDAYYKWVTQAEPENRAHYAAIAVIPRGDEIPLLFDSNAFLLPIAPEYKYVSSSRLKESASCNNAEIVSKDSAVLRMSNK